jgi:hypothetical protein
MLATLTTPCWYLARSDGTEWEPYGDGEGAPHFDSSDAAGQRAKRDAEPGLAPALFDKPCAVITCDGCDGGPEDEAWGEVHFPDEAFARSMASLYDFTVDGSNAAHCEGCNKSPSSSVSA